MTTSVIRFRAKLLRPAAGEEAQRAGPAGWTFLVLPKQASAKLTSRGQVSMEGTLNGAAFQATVEPDGQGGHWLRVDREVRAAAGAEVGDMVALEIAPVARGREPEPVVPDDLAGALAAAVPRAREVWSEITPAARRDWIHWIVSAKQAQTRARRIGNACDMLAKGKRRPCCFDRSGIYSKGLSCPAAADE